MNKLFREQTGGLKESLQTTKEVTCLKDILDFENAKMKDSAYPLEDQTNYYFKARVEYIGDESKRCGEMWKESYYVILRAEHFECCIGMCKF